MMRLKSFWACAAVCLIGSCLVTSTAHAAVPGVETWDDGSLTTNGWVGNTTSANVVHVAAGGNPDGHILSRRAGTFDIGALIDSDDSTDFTGDYSGIGGASVDLRFISGQFTDAWLRFRTGPAVNGWRYPLTNAFPADVWTTYAVAFDPAWSDVDAMAAGWVREDAAAPMFAATMASVDTAEVRVAGSTDSLLVGIDNFTLRGIPEPGTGLLVLAAIPTLCMIRRNRAACQR